MLPTRVAQLLAGQVRRASIDARRSRTLKYKKRVLELEQLKTKKSNEDTQTSKSNGSVHYKTRDEKILKPRAPRATQEDMRRDFTAGDKSIKECPHEECKKMYKKAHKCPFAEM